MIIDIYLLNDVPTFRPSERAKRYRIKVKHGLINENREPKIDFDADTVTLWTSLSSEAIVVWTARGVWQSAQGNTWGFVIQE